MAVSGLTELTRQWFERVWQNGDSAYIDEGLTEVCEISGLTPEPITSAAGFHQFHASLTAVFERFDVTFERVLEKEDTCVGVVLVRAVHKASGRPVAFRSSFFARFEDGRICEVSNLVDYLSVLIQVGAIAPDVLEQGLSG